MFRTRTSVFGPVGMRGTAHARLRRGRGLLALAAVVAAAVAVIALIAQRPAAGRRVESIFQDDQLLLYQPLTPAGTATVQRTLTTLKGLGADRIRVTVVWWDVAPDHTATVAPRLDLSDPAAYPAAVWAAYDRLVRLAALDRLGIDFNVSDPAPLWANSANPPAPTAVLSTHWAPSAARFGQFMRALGRRYSGRYTPAGTPARGPASGPLPRVSFWTIWNEPNIPGWLAPQWRAAGRDPVANSPRLYRGYAGAGFAALRATGHTPARDTILIGELAPEGENPPPAGTPLTPISAEYPMTPLPFLRALYCLDRRYRPLRGAAAVAVGCPPRGTAAAFVNANPGLFEITGFAHHPYELALAPQLPVANPDEAPLSELHRIEAALDRAFAAYGSDRRLPLYLTEYGYETNPPNPYRGVSLRRQSAFLNLAEYLAWRDPRVRAMAQFLLQDSPPNAAYPRGSFKYWSTFQTGLEFLGGAPKPSLRSYRLPIYLPDTSVRAGGPLTVWGMLRMAPNGTSQTAQIQWRPPAGRYRTLATVTTSDPSGFLEARVSPSGSGAIRIAWRSARGGEYDSRAVGISVRPGA